MVTGQSVPEPYEALSSVYDRWMEGHVPYRDIVDHVLTIVGGGPARVLDLCTGTATVPVLLAAYGIQAVGIDRSGSMLERAQAKVGKAGAGGAVDLLLGDALAGEWPEGPFDVVLCTGDSVNYLPPADFPGLARRAYDALGPGGVFLFDLNSDHKLIRQFGTSTVAGAHDDFAYIWRNRLHGDEAAIDFDITLFVRAEHGLWRQHAERHRQHVHRLPGTTASLRAAGFARVTCTAGYGSQQRAVEVDTDRWVFTAEKGGRRGMTRSRVIDMHTQLGVDHWMSTQGAPVLEGSGEWTHQLALDDLLATRDELALAGTDLVGIAAFPFPSAPPEGYGEGNATVMDAAERAGSQGLRIAPFYAVNPGVPAEREWLREQLSQGRPCAGIKLNPFLGKPGGYDLFSLAEDEALVDVLDQHDLVVAMHVGTGREHLTRPRFPNVQAGPAAAVELARRLPQRPMLMFHALRMHAASLAAAADLPNVHVEISGISSLGSLYEGGFSLLQAEDDGGGPTEPAQALRWLTGEFGLGERLVFGSAHPFCSWWGSTVPEDLALLYAAFEDEGLREALAWRNACRLLGWEA